MMLNSAAQASLKSALKAAEDLSTVASVNIANSNTLGYKALKGYFAPDCDCYCFSAVLNSLGNKISPQHPRGNLHLEITRDGSPGRTVAIGDKKYESSNVDTAAEFNNLITAASLTRATLAAIQLENRNQQEILNLGRQ